MVLDNYALGFMRISGYKDTSGTTRTSYGDYNNGLPYGLQNQYNSDNGMGCKVVVGTGDTAPTASDYALASSASLTHVGTIANTLANNQAKNITSTYRNDGESAVTIKEVGINCYTTFRYMEYCNILFARKVLETPVTIQPGEQYTFTYLVAMNN